MCRDHWAMLPARLQRAIILTWNARDMAAYQENVRQAIDAIDMIEGTYESPFEERFVIPPMLTIEWLEKQRRARPRAASRRQAR